MSFNMKGLARISFALLVLFQYTQCLPRIDPLVDTKVGLIRGLRADDGNYSKFLGIPYAQVNPDNPFGESTPQPKFEETFEAYDDSAVCPQWYWWTEEIGGNPDCLQLSVYVPDTANSNNRLPVMVWIYGGAFERGEFSQKLYKPTYLIKHDVIIVAINYRVGPYGFMCLDTPEVPGNQGLKDQYLAMQWVKDNIEAFGGDANQITLFGLSAGGHSIDLHLLSQKPVIYDKVIMQSGSSLAATVLYEPDKLAHIKLAQHLGFETKDTNEAISFLAKSDSNLVIAAFMEIGIVFKPCVENSFDGVEPFLNSSWVHAGTPKVRNMPVLTGYNEHELAAPHFNKDEEYYKNLKIISNYLKRIFNFEEEELQEMSDSVAHFYFGDEAISSDVKMALINLDSDFTYIHPIQRSIQKYIEAKARNVYYYVFTYLGGRNALLDNGGGGDDSSYVCCAGHADELPYLFNMINKPPPTAHDEVVIERMTTMWTNFAKYGDPTPQTTDLLPVKWEPLTKESFTYMDIGAELTLGSRPAHDRMAYWDLFYRLKGDKNKV
uniref:Carboxylic ester hydrolase n=1 Tax=Spodoptera frugiperda TaxID=7108 RepID=A0A2H1WRP2_SPOFR